MKTGLAILFISLIAMPEASSAQWSDPPRQRPRRSTRPPAKPLAPPVAPEDSTAQSPSSSRRDSGFWVGALYSTANEVSYQGQVTLFGSPSSFTATENTAGAVGVAGGYRLLRDVGFGFDAYAGYEFPRSSQGIKGTAGNTTVTGTYEGDVSTSLLSLVANANYSFGRWAYVSGGINFPIVFSSGKQDLQGLPGYQIGVGSRLTERISLELDYRVLRMKGTIDVPPMNLQIEEASFPGFVLFIHYSI